MAPVEAAQHVSGLIELLGSIYQPVSDKRSADRQGDLLLAHMLKVQSLASGILLLGQYYHVEEVAVLTRTLSEVVVNSCYLLVAEELEVDRFMKFDYVKGFSRTEKLRRHIDQPIDYPTEIVEKLAQMSEGACGEIRRTEKDSSWSQHSLEQRCDRRSTLAGSKV